MKLLTQTSRSYLLISVVVFLISGLIFIRLLHNIFQKQMDEAITEERRLIEQTINYSDSVPDFRSIFGHMIDVTILNNPHKPQHYIRDTLMYDSDLGSFAAFRHLFLQGTSVRNKGYTINIYKPLRESESLITEIVIALALVFVSLLFLLVLANYFISRSIWVPFYRTIGNLRDYDINQEAPLELTGSNIHEFNLLNETLIRMAAKIRKDYLSLKEFNENAAHELLTPIAIIKSKLELLIQREDLDEKQLQLISSVFDATNRISKLHQGLLLISKIENNQFARTDVVNMEEVLLRGLEHFEEMTSHMGITVTVSETRPVSLTMNQTLAEILVTNLLSNAIRHNIPSGRITVSLDEKTLRVSNTGLPPKSDPATLFERFRKSGQNPDSVGLGLSIVEKIATLYRMRVTYTFAEGIHCLEISF